MPSILKMKTDHLHNFFFISILTIMLGLLTAACTTDNATSNASISNSKGTSRSPVNARSTTSVAQIYSAETGFIHQQISRDVDAAQLTVEQLKAYADRCVPGKSSYNKDIDCSELSLRLKKVFRSDDKVAEALITLNRLGRSDNRKNISDELEGNNDNLSLSARAIASGALDPSSTADLPQEQISDDLEQFLNENGLDINAGIIVNSGG